MQVSVINDSNEPSWLDLILECIEIGYSPDEVRSMILQCKANVNEG